MGCAIVRRVGFCYVLLIILVTVVLSVSVNDSNYGPYTPHWSHLQPCRGPKHRNLTSYSMVFVKENNTYQLQMNITVLLESKIENVKVLVTPVSGNKRTSSQWKYKFDPCQNPAFAAALSTITDKKRCCLIKGNHFMDYNISDLMKKLIGKEFFYGDYFFKSMVTAVDGNLLCLQYNLKIEKKI